MVLPSSVPKQSLHLTLSGYQLLGLQRSYPLASGRPAFLRYNKSQVSLIHITIAFHVFS